MLPLFRSLYLYQPRKGMRHCTIFFLLILVSQVAISQELLPNITVKNFNNKIIVSWQNGYKVPITSISIQRSFDSLKNYNTIGSVLNPQNLENGYADNKPPYNKMYYRVFISFEGGAYLFSSIVRPVKEMLDTDSSKVTPESIAENTRFPWQSNPYADAGIHKPPGKDSVKNDPEMITYPSQRIYSVRENNVILHLTDAATKKYHAKFYDDQDKLLFELTKLKEEYLIIEKVNFVHAGWFHFELFENDLLIEKNKFYVGKDIKNSNDINKRSGNK
ncbi:MAG: hypothetical protein ABIO04_04205 [Ferruginibacter sp.]